MDTLDLGPYCSDGDFWAIFGEEDERGEMQLVIPSRNNQAAPGLTE